MIVEDDLDGEVRANIVGDLREGVGEELLLAADIIDEMSSDPIRGLGAAEGDVLTVIEWRDEVTTLKDAPAASSTHVELQKVSTP